MGSLEGSKFEICPNVASVLAMGTANPPTCYNQEDFAEMYALVTKSEKLSDYREKLKEIGEKAWVKKRYISLTLDLLESNPNMIKHMAPSMDARQDFAKEIIPQLAKQAATEAISEWGRPNSEITHLVFSTFSALQMPGMDYKLAKLLDLKPTVKRTMLYLQGCYGGGAALRVAKDLAENNDGSRVLVVCCEIIVDFFRGPPPPSATGGGGSSSMVEQAIFGDGAAAAIIGKYDANDVNSVNEHHPLFQLVTTSQRFIPDTENDMAAHVSEAGQNLRLSKRIPSLISENIEKALVEGFSPLGISDWNSIFWVAHPGGPSILRRIENKLGLDKDKLRISWDVLRDYGNMSSPTVLFVLNETRKRSVEEGKASTGLGLEYGVLFSFGPGLTIETIVLKGVSI